MKERPILFNAEMVRALLDGRKTQTRRTVKPRVEELIRCHAGDPGEECEVSFLHNTWQDDDRKEHGPEWLCYAEDCPEEGVIPIGQCPYGQPGDRLWVRETWQGPLLEEGGDYPDGYHSPECCEYAADGGPAPEFVTPDDEVVQRWRPSIHMPRWASRITLEIVSVRVERLQEISEEDAKAEGIRRQQTTGWFSVPGVDGAGTSARAAFALLWQSINGPDSWDANPWVWVVEFKRVDEARSAA
mgnify:CR=1 FL=1